MKKNRAFVVERLESRRCLASWYQMLADDDFRPSAIAQFNDPDSIAVVGNAPRVDGISHYADGVALEISPVGLTTRSALISIDPPLPFPSEVSTVPRDAEFTKEGELLVVGASASGRSRIDTLPASRHDGEGTIWRGTFDLGFDVGGIGFPGDLREGYIESYTTKNHGVGVGQNAVWATYFLGTSAPRYVLLNGERLAGIASATNGSRIAVTGFDSGDGFVFDIESTGALGRSIRLERPDDVFSVFVKSMNSEGRTAGFGEVYDTETARSTSIALIWNADGSLAKRIEYDGQSVDCRVMADGVVFFEVSTPTEEEPLGNEGSYVYLMESDTTISMVDWVESLKLHIPQLRLTSSQRVADAEWSFNRQWLNILVASTALGESMVIHLDEAKVRVAAHPWTNPINYLNVNDDARSLVSPVDALIVINRLNQQSDRALPYPRTNHTIDPYYYDTSRDGFLSPIDALLVINELNSPTSTLAIGEYDVPPVELPNGFKPWTGIELPSNEYIVAGSYNNLPAFLTISQMSDGTSNVSPVEILPSIAVAAGGEDGYGRVRSVLLNDKGQLEFVGSSRSNSFPFDEGAGEATLWTSEHVPIGLGNLFGSVESLGLDGSANGIYVGASNTEPVVYSRAGGIRRVPNGGFGGVTAISRDGKVLVGADTTRLAYWTAQIAGGDYELRSVDLPASGFDNGIIYDISGTWMAGIYFSEELLDFAGAVWDSRDGSVIYDFVAAGPAGDIYATKVLETGIVAVDTASSPYIYIEGDKYRRNVNGILGNLPLHLGSIVYVQAFVESSSNHLALTALTSQGDYIFASLKTTLKPPD